MIQMIGNRPNAAPSVATASAVPTGMPQTMTAIRIATTSAIAPAMCARSFRPAEQDEQRGERNHRDERAQEERIADRIEDLLVHSLRLPR